MKSLIAAFALMFMIACKSKSAEKEKPTLDTTQRVTPPPPAPPVGRPEDTLVIEKQAAVYYRPDSAQMEAWKKSVGEKDFETVTDDWSFYMMSSNDYLKTTKLPIEDASGKKVIKFIKADRSVALVGLDTLKNYWGFWLFTPAKNPEFGDIVSIETSYKSYFLNQ